MEVEKNTGAENGCCMLATEQLGCSPGSHLAAWLDAVVFAQAERIGAKLYPATGSAQLSFYPMMY